MIALINGLKLLLTEFQKTWAERDALLRVVGTIEHEAGKTANWESVLEASHQRAQGLFQPALIGLQTGIPLDVVIEKLLLRLAESRK